MRRTNDDHRIVARSQIHLDDRHTRPPEAHQSRGVRPAVTSRSWAAPAYGGCSASSGSDKISTCGRGLIERFADVRSTSFAGVRPMVSVDIARVDDLLRLAHEHGFDYEDDPHSRGTDLLGACSSFSSDDAAAPTDAGNAGANLADSAGLDAGNADAASEPFCASLSPKSAPRRPALRDSRFASDGDVDSAALSDAVLDAVTLSVALGAEHLALAARLTCGILELPRGGRSASLDPSRPHGNLRLERVVQRVNGRLELRSNASAGVRSRPRANDELARVARDLLADLRSLNLLQGASEEAEGEDESRHGPMDGHDETPLR